MSEMFYTIKVKIGVTADDSLDGKRHESNKFDLLEDSDVLVQSSRVSDTTFAELVNLLQ